VTAVLTLTSLDSQPSLSIMNSYVVLCGIKLTVTHFVTLQKNRRLIEIFCANIGPHLWDVFKTQVLVPIPNKHV